MPKLLVIVHTLFDAALLRGYFKKLLPAEDVLSIPFSKNLELSDYIAQLPQDLDLVIVESNFGTPSSSDINKELLHTLLQSFPSATIVATSGTMASLDAAMKLDERIMVMGKGNLKPEDCDLTRVHSLTTLKNLLLPPQPEDDTNLTPLFNSMKELSIADSPPQETNAPHTLKKKLRRTD